MNTDLDNRESRVLDFINRRNQEASKIKQMQDISNNPELQLRKINKEAENGKSICLNTLLGRLYKDALPYDDPTKNMSDDAARDIMKNFISDRTGGKDTEFYFREAIRRNNSTQLKNMLTEAEKISKDFVKQKSKDIGTINMQDLNFNMNLDDEKLNDISKNLELDEIADIIHNNVQKALQDESDKAKKEEEETQKIEDALTDDDSVTDEASMESAIARMKMNNQPQIYQPSLFESIMIGKTKTMTESVDGRDVIYESIEEYTKLNIIKALRLEKFDMNSIKKMADNYVLG